MKKILTLSLILICVYADAQNPFRVYDFSGIDFTTIDEKQLHLTIDSIARTTGIDSLRRLYGRVVLEKASVPGDYGAFVVSMQFNKFSFKTLNKKLEAAGLERMTETLPSLNFGADVASGRFLLSWVLGVRVKERVQNDDIALSVGSAGMLAFHVGYDIVNLNRFRLYPMVGLSWQKFTMDIRKKNFPYDQDVDYYLTNLYQSSFKQRSLAAQFGVEADMQLTKRDAWVGWILAIRAGYQTSLATGEFRQHHHGYDFDLGSDGSEKYLSIGIKFFGKQ